MSFFRFRQHKVRFADPSDAQVSAMVTAMGVAEYSLLKAALNYLNTSTGGRNKFDAKELEDMEQTLVGWKSYFELKK